MSNLSITVEHTYVTGWVSTNVCWSLIGSLELSGILAFGYQEAQGLDLKYNLKSSLYHVLGEETETPRSTDGDPVSSSLSITTGC